MSNLTNARRPVNAERQPFRPLLAPPQATYWTDAVGAVHVLLSSRRKADAYELIPISTDIGGCAFRWFKAGGECYDVLASGTDSSCTCKGWIYTGGCKHLETTFDLLKLGVLQAAPASCEDSSDE